MIIFWPKIDWPDKPFEYQRLGFKATASLSEAAQVAEKLVNLLAKSGATKAHVKNKEKPQAFVAGIYKASAFKDYSSDPYNAADNKAREFIKKTLADIRASKTKGKTKPITFKTTSTLIDKIVTPQKVR